MGGMRLQGEPKIEPEGPWGVQGAARVLETMLEAWNMLEMSQSAGDAWEVLIASAGLARNAWRTLGLEFRHLRPI